MPPCQRYKINTDGCDGRARCDGSTTVTGGDGHRGVCAAFIHIGWLFAVLFTFCDVVQNTVDAMKNLTPSFAKYVSSSSFLILKSVFVFIRANTVE